MLKNRIMISLPTNNPEAYRLALKAVTSNHGTNIGLWIHSLIIGSEYGEEFQKQFTKFFADSGYQNIQMDTIDNTDEDKQP